MTKDGALNTTVATYFKNLKADITFSGLLDLLASADEFIEDETLIKLRKSITKAGMDEYARLGNAVRDGLDGKEGWVGYSKWAVGKKRARVLIGAHFLRIPIKDPILLRGKFIALSRMLKAMSDLVPSHRETNHDHHDYPPRDGSEFHRSRLHLVISDNHYSPSSTIHHPSRSSFFLSSFTTTQLQSRACHSSR
jgi:hypothetical protein